MFPEEKYEDLYYYLSLNTPNIKAAREVFNTLTTAEALKCYGKACMSIFDRSLIGKFLLDPKLRNSENTPAHLRDLDFAMAEKTFLNDTGKKREVNVIGDSVVQRPKNSTVARNGLT